MSNATARASWNALIRTHHITSRKKVTKLRQAASNDDVFTLLRSGGSPGIMYVEGSKTGVESWVAAVQRLRYKDFQLAARPAAIEQDVVSDQSREPVTTGLFETESVKDFATQMENRGVLDWWRKAMGYSGSGDRL